MLHRSLLAAGSMCFFLACSQTTLYPDAGVPPDAGQNPDGGAPDGGNPDGGAPDSGPATAAPLLLDYTFRVGNSLSNATSIFQIYLDGTTFHQELTCCPPTSVTLDAGVIDPVQISNIVTTCEIVRVSPYTDAGIACPVAGCSQGHLNCVLDGGAFTEENYIPLPLRILNIQTTAPDGLTMLDWVDTFVTNQLP